MSIATLTKKEKAERPILRDLKKKKGGGEGRYRPRKKNPHTARTSEKSRGKRYTALGQKERISCRCSRTGKSKRYQRGVPKKERGIITPTKRKEKKREPCHRLCEQNDFLTSAVRTRRGASWKMGNLIRCPACDHEQLVKEEGGPHQGWGGGKATPFMQI